MIVSIYINAQIDSDACWVPVDGKAGLEEDMKELVSSAVSDALEGIVVENIKVVVDNDI
tara:strand:+ start:253 stop:429 length:177 start_codon:yes stop_codon:yes gene_type:complete